MRAKWSVLLVALVIATAACSKSTTSGNATPTASASPTAAALAVEVSVDAKNPTINTAFLSYFPATATVHPGDTVNFKLVDEGEPHTVTLGTLADAAVTAFASVQDPNNPGVTATAADDAVPQFFPNGPGDAFQIAAVPCVVASGAVTTATATTACATPSAFKGTEAYFNSGWMTPTSTFSVKLAPDIKPGTYRYLCLLHREEMAGQIVVAPPGTTVPSASEQAATGQADLAKTIAALTPAVGPLATGQNPQLKMIPHGPNAVLGGSGLQEVHGAGINAFGPSTVTTTVNGTITWYLIGPHTVTFNPPSDLTGPRKGASTHVDDRAFTPLGGAGQSQGPPSGPPPTGPPVPKIVETVDGKTFDGSSFHNSGLILSFPPDLVAYKMKFTKAGTYPYSCIIHPGMIGVVVVK